MMNRLEEVTGIFPRIRIFLENTMEEMRKSSWPTKEQLLESTLLVLVALVITSAFVAVIDLVLSGAIQYLISF